MSSSILRPTRAYVKGKYAANFESVVSKVDEAIQQALPQSQKDQFDKVFVLSMNWSNDNMGVAPLSQELEYVLTSLYGFHVEHYTINANPASGNVEFEFDKRVSRFMSNRAGPRTLLMYVYSGHAVGGPGVFDTFWLGDDRPSVNAPRINWQVLRSMADAAPGDALYILDCCGAASAALRANGNEYMCASAVDSVASSVLSESFTRRFIDLLKRYQETPMSVAALHSKMWFEAGEPSTYLDTNPVHFGASSTGHSIVLRPLKKEPKDLQKLKQESAASVGKVLVTVSLKGRATLPDEPAFEKWLLTMIPPNLRDIKVQAVFDSDSILILATIPIAAWDMLKEDGTIAYCAVVKSDNLLLAFAAATGQAQERDLAERFRPRGKENQPFGGSSSGGAQNVK